MNEVRVGVVGIGNMGFAHASCIYQGKVNGMRLTAVCDNMENKRKICAEHFPDVACFADYNEMITSGKIDAIIIAVPHRLHSLIAKNAFENGLHVLTEKPADVSVTTAKALHETAKKSGKVFGIMFNQRTNPLFQKAREIVKSGQLGTLKRAVWIITNWYRTQAYYDSGAWRASWSGEGGGVLLNQAPHNLDLWQWICGMPCSVTAFCDTGKYHNIEVEDDVTIFARYADGGVGTFITTTGEFPGTNRLEISGSLGKLVLEGGILKWWKLKESEREFCFKQNQEPEQPECIEITQDTPETAHCGILQNFTNAILHGEQLLAPGYDGVNELTISNAAYLSSWKGNVEVKLPFNGAEFDAFLAEKIKNSTYRELNNEEVPTSEYKTRWQVNW